MSAKYEIGNIVTLRPLWDQSIFSNKTGQILDKFIINEIEDTCWIYVVKVFPVWGKPGNTVTRQFCEFEIYETDSQIRARKLKEIGI